MGDEESGGLLVRRGVRERRQGDVGACVAGTRDGAAMSDEGVVYGGYSTVERRAVRRRESWPHETGRLGLGGNLEILGEILYDQV